MSAPAALSGPEVASDRRERFWRDGYLVVEDLLPPDRMARLRTELQAILDDPRSHASAAAYIQDCYATVWGVVSEHLWIDDEGMADEIAYLRDNPKAHAVASDLLGAPARAQKVSMQVMYGQCGCRQPWHQDHTPGNELWWLNCMYYLDDMHEDNGHLMVVPGSHTKPLRARLPDYELIPGAVKVMPKAGSAVFFHMAILHAAAENRSAAKRVGVKTHYSLPSIDPFGQRHEQRYSRGVRRAGRVILDHDDGEHSYFFQ